MHHLARLALRPLVLAGLTGAEAVASARVSAASKPVLSALPLIRHWSSPSSPSEEALRKAERMVELMSQSPQMQQMMMSVLPGPMRNPEVFKQVFGDPTMRRKIAEMIASRGITIPDHLLDRMSPDSMDSTFARAQRLGLDPGQLFTKLMAHPGLLAKLQQPRVMAAFLDIAEDPSRQAKYEGDKELLEVVFKVREIMGTAKPPSTTIPVASTVSAADSTGAAAEATTQVPPPPGQPPRPDSVSTASGEEPGTSSSGAIDTNGAATGPETSFNPLIALMSTDPKAARWLENPQVMAALEEVHKSPWKTVKYIFNRDVMEAFKDLKELMRGKRL